MGVTTDATIAYGIDLGEEFDLEALDLTEEELEDPYPDEILTGRLTAHIRDPYPAWYWDEYPQFGEDDTRHKEWRIDHTDELNVYQTAKSAAIRDFPFEFDTHCSAEYPMYMLVARGSITTTHRGYPKAVPLVDMVDPPAWPLERLYEVFDIRPAIAESEIDLEAPQWLLYSYWG